MTVVKVTNLGAEPNFGANLASKDDLALFSPQISKPPIPIGAVIRFGRVIVVIVQTSRRTIQLFHESLQTLIEIYEGLREAINRVRSLNEIESYSAPSHDYGLDPVVEYPVRKAPTWKFQTPTLPGIIRSRASKVRALQRLNPHALPPKQQHLLSLTAKTFREFNRLATDGVMETTKLGAKVQNSSNCCYVDSVIHALRFSKSFQKRLEAVELRDNPVVQELRKLYQILEGKDGEEKRTVTGQEIEHFRQTLIESGMRVVADPNNRDMAAQSHQEETGVVCEFILGQVGFEAFPYVDKAENPTGLPVTSLDPELPIRHNHLLVEMDPTKNQDSDLHKFVRNRKAAVELEPFHIRNTIADPKKNLSLADYEDQLNALSLEIEQAIEQKKQELIAKNGTITPDAEESIRRQNSAKIIEVSKTVMFFEHSVPPILPIYLNRLYGNESGQLFLDHKIIPNQYVDIPIIDKPGFSARYEFISAVSYDRARKHYLAWSQFHHKDKSVYGEFDGMANAPRVHVSGQEPMDKITKFSRFYFYELVGLVPS